MTTVATEYLGRGGVYDPLADNQPDSAANVGDATSSGMNEHKPHKPLVQFFKPSELLAYKPPPGHCLVGDMHVQRGALAILGGPPGVGKSRGIFWLALLGARGQGEWFGLRINVQFRTLWLQSENGLVRLHHDLQQMQEIGGLDDWIRISAPPVCGLALQDARFRREVVSRVKDFAPHVIALDPWNQAVRDTQERDFVEALSRLREIVAESPENASALVAHHLRKPKAEDRHKGRSLAYLLSGSNALYGAARSVFIMQPASDDLQDRRLVFTPSKCNDSQTVVDRSAWELKEGLFVPVADFDFEGFDGARAMHEPKVNEEHIKQLFKDERWLQRGQAVQMLKAIAKVGRSTAYKAMEWNGRFAHLLVEHPTHDDWIGLRSTESDVESGVD